MAAYPAVPPKLLLLAALEVCLVVQARIWWVIGSWVLHVPRCTWSSNSQNNYMLIEQLTHELLQP